MMTQAQKAALHHHPNHHHQRHTPTGAAPVQVGMSPFVYTYIYTLTTLPVQMALTRMWLRDSWAVWRDTWLWPAAKVRPRCTEALQLWLTRLTSTPPIVLQALGLSHYLPPRNASALTSSAGSTSPSSAADISAPASSGHDASADASGADETVSSTTAAPTPDPGQELMRRAIERSAASARARMTADSWARAWQHHISQWLSETAAAQWANLLRIGRAAGSVAQMMVKWVRRALAACVPNAFYFPMACSSVASSASPCQAGITVAASQLSLLQPD
jgi:hypothetical protein